MYALVPCNPSVVWAIQHECNKRFVGSTLKDAEFWSPTAKEMQRARRLYDNMPRNVLKFISTNTGRIPVVSADAPGEGAAVLLSGDKWGIVIGGLKGKKGPRLKYMDNDRYKKLVSDDKLTYLLQHELIHIAMPGALQKMGGGSLRDLAVFSKARILQHAMNAGYSHKYGGGKFYDGIMDESMAMVGGYYTDGDTVRSLAEKIYGLRVVEKVKTSPYGRRMIYKLGALTMTEAILYSRAWFKLINGQDEKVR